jgi:hypothetical protein
MTIISDTENKYSTELIDLFSTENNLEKFYFWQDRSPDFYKAYSHYCKDHNYYRIMFDNNSKAIISVGLINTHVKGPYKTYYITDWFVDPIFRKKKIVWNFMNESTPLFSKFVGQNICFAIENKVGVLDRFAKLNLQHNVYFKYIGTTTSFDFYLSEFENKKLEANEVWDLQTLIKNYSFKRILELIEDSKFTSPLTPEITKESLEKLTALNNLYFIPTIYNGNLQALWVLCDLMDCRKIKSTGKKSLLFESQLKILPQEPIKYLMGSFWGAEELLSQEKIKEVMSLAKSKGYHIINFRDIRLPKEILAFKSKMIYNRKVAVMYNQKDVDYWEYFFRENNQQIKLKLQSMYL